MDKTRTLNLAILAINTLQYPDATSDKDFYELDGLADDVIEALVAMREEPDWKQRFVALYTAVAACEAPEGTQVDDVLGDFDRADPPKEASS